MTRYVWDSKKRRLVPEQRQQDGAGVRIRKDAYRGIDGRGAVVTQIKRWHPAVLAAGVPVNSKGRAVITSAAERDRLMDAFNAYEESRSGQRLVWTREAADDEDRPRGDDGE